MGVSPDCIAAVREASGGTFTDSEATDLIRRMEQRRRAEEAAGNLDHLDDRLRAAAAADADRARIAAALAKKHAALAALAFDRATRQVEALRAAGLDRRKALLAFLEGTTRNVEGGRESVAATALAFRARYLEQLNLALVRDPETAALVRSGDQGFARAVVREMRELREGGRPGVTGNRQAQELARLYGEIAERARGDLNRSGATIGRLDGWSPQAHAADRVVQVGADEWVDFILPRLDRDRTFPDMPEELARLALRDVHQAIITGVERNPSTAETTGRIGPANLANSLSAARVLHFRDATAWLQYAERFGAGNIHEAMLAHLNSAAKYAAQLQRLGPNPEQTMTRLRAQLAREAASDRSLPGKERQRLARALAPGNQQGSVASAWAEVSGLTAVPVSIRAAQIGTAARAWQTLAKLGGAVISSISDLPVRAAAMTYQGRPIAAAWGDALGGLRRGSPEAREAAAVLNAGLDGIHNSIVAAGIAEDMPLGRLQRITSLMFRWQGMTWWTDRMKAGSAQALARWMALNAGSRFDALPPRYRAVLRQQGITPQEWDAIRRLARQADDGAAYITPDTVASLPRAVLAGLAREQLEAQQRGLADRIARREQSNATEAGWITRRTDALAASLQRQLAQLQRQNQAAAGATDRRTQRLRQRIEELQLRLSELAEFSQAVAEGRAWTPATEEAAPEAPNTTPQTGAPIVKAELTPEQWAAATVEFRSSMAGWDLDRLYARGQENQDAITQAFAELAATVPGASARSAPLKKRAVAEEKMVRKSYRDTTQLTDVVRGGFDANSPETADAIVAALAERYPVLDEGWASTPLGYFDRKVLLRLDDGTIAEVQIWPPGMFDAKETKGGHKAYEAARKPDVTPERMAELTEFQRQLYGETLDAAGPAWQRLYDEAEAAAGRGAASSGGTGGSDASARSAQSGATDRPDSATSTQGTGDQASPGASTANAGPPGSSDSTAGRPSQSTNRMGEPSRSSNVSLSGDAATEGGRVFSPRAERYLDESDPATLAARAEGELRARLDALRRAIGSMNRAMGQAEQRRLAELTSWWNARQQELAEFTRRMEERAEARRQATERELGDYDARVQRVLEDARLALEIKLRRFFADEMGFAFLETDAASRRLTLWGTRPGTVTGELLRALAQFKGFPVAFTQRVLGRALQGYAPEERALQARNMGVLLAGLMVTGYLAMTVKDFLRGYGPRDPTKPATLLAALMQSGGAGIYGDFLFAQGSRFGNSTLETLAGPLLGTAAGTVNLAQKLRDGDAKGGEALNLALQNTPFLGLWYLRPALDFLVLNALRESLSPGFMQRQRRNRAKDFGQEPHHLVPASLF